MPTDSHHHGFAPAVPVSDTVLSRKGHSEGPNSFLRPVTPLSWFPFSVIAAVFCKWSTSLFVHPRDSEAAPEQLVLGLLLFGTPSARPAQESHNEPLPRSAKRARRARVIHEHV